MAALTDITAGSLIFLEQRLAIHTLGTAPIHATAADPDLGKLLVRCKPLPVGRFLASGQGYVLTYVGLPLLAYPFIGLLVGLGAVKLFDVGTQPAIKIVMLATAIVVWAVLLYFTYYHQSKDYLHVYERGFVLKFTYPKKTIRFDDLEKITFGMQIFGKAIGDEEEALTFLHPTYNGPPPNAAHSAIYVYRRDGSKFVVRQFFQRYERRDLVKMFEIIDTVRPGSLPARYVNPGNKPDWSAAAGRVGK